MAGDVGSDTCLGEVFFDVDEAESPPVVGTASCTFSGDLSAFLPGLDAEMTAELAGDSMAGALVLEIPIIGSYEIPWSGSYDGDVIEVDEANSFEVSGFAIDYVVVFEATRD